MCYAAGVRMWYDSLISGGLSDCSAVLYILVYILDPFLVEGVVVASRESESEQYIDCCYHIDHHAETYCAMRI
jgi:hypothetical protein